MRVTHGDTYNMEVNPRNRELVETSTIISLIIFILLIALTTVFVGSEFALVKLEQQELNS